MKKAGQKAISIFIISAFIYSLSVTNIFAALKELDQEEIEKREEKEKAKMAEPIVRPRVEYNAEGLKDPFQEPVIEVATPDKGQKTIMEPEVAPPSLTVQGVIWGGKFPQAIINSKVVKAGDTIEGARVVSIDKGGVAVFFNGRQFNLPSPAGGSEPSKEQ